jgi:hypothetical protein
LHLLALRKQDVFARENRVPVREVQLLPQHLDALRSFASFASFWRCDGHGYEVSILKRLKRFFHDEPVTLPRMKMLYIAAACQAHHQYRFINHNRSQKIMNFCWRKVLKTN